MVYVFIFFYLFVLLIIYYNLFTTIVIVSMLPNKITEKYVFTYFSYLKNCRDVYFVKGITNSRHSILFVFYLEG